MYLLYVTKENIKEHNPNWPKIISHPHIKLVIWVSESWKTNSLFSLIRCQPGIDQIYLQAKDRYEAQYHLLINKSESTCLKHIDDFTALIE